MKPHRSKDAEHSNELLPEIIADMFRRLNALESESRAFLGGVSKKLDHLDGQIKSLEKSSSKIANLKKWNFIFKWLLGLLAAGIFSVIVFVLHLFWRHPDWWPKLVEFLK